MRNAKTSNFNLFECKISTKSNIVRICFIVLFINCIWKGLKLITFHLIPIKLTRFFSYYCETVEHVSLDIIANNWILFPFVLITYQFTQILSFIFSDLSRNKLTELPQECTDYFLLERLLLYNNSIRTIPDSIVYMQTLHFLDLR